MALQQGTSNHLAMARRSKPIPKAHRPKFHFRAWRKFRRLTQQQLADRVDMSASSISQIESGEQGFSDVTLRSLAHALDCQPGDLLSRDPFVEAAESEFEIYVKQLDAEKRRRALMILKAALDDDEKQA